MTQRNKERDNGIREEYQELIALGVKHGALAIVGRNHGLSRQRIWQITSKKKEG